MYDGVVNSEQEELVDIIAFALWRNARLRPRKPTLEETRIWARAVVEHMACCGVECTRKPPSKLHRSP